MCTALTVRPRHMSGVSPGEHSNNNAWSVVNRTIEDEGSQIIITQRVLAAGTINDLTSVDSGMAQKPSRYRMNSPSSVFFACPIWVAAGP